MALDYIALQRILGKGIYMITLNKLHCFPVAKKIPRRCMNTATPDVSRRKVGHNIDIKMGMLLLVVVTIRDCWRLSVYIANRAVLFILWHALNIAMVHIRYWEGVMLFIRY